ncbi:MAG: hypothetical protein KDD45_08310 [Bdellovibrionales bacterium]|nr:hypothetical protein [Bdellovibrionales bacterium]
MIAKMLSKNMFEVPELEKVAELMENKAKLVSPKKKAHAANIEIDIEHIKLENSRKKDEIDTKRRLRNCCIEKEESL